MFSNHVLPKSEIWRSGHGAVKLLAIIWAPGAFDTASKYLVTSRNITALISELTSDKFFIQNCAQ